MRNFSKMILAGVIMMLVSTPVFAMQREDRVNFFGDINIARPVSGDVVSIAGNIDVKEAVKGDVVSVVGNINIQGEVKGDVVAVLGKVTLAEGAIVNGDVVAIGARGIEKAVGAEIRGDAVSISVTQFDLTGFEAQRLSLGWWQIEFLRLIQTLMLIVVLVLGFVVALLDSNKIHIISQQLEQRFIKKLVIGILVSIAFVGALPILAITIIGLPIAMIIFFVAYLIGFSAVCAYLGQKIMELFNGKTNIYGEYVIGAIVVGITHVTFHYSWWIIGTIAIVSIGLGMDEWFRNKNKI